MQLHLKIFLIEKSVVNVLRLDLIFLEQNKCLVLLFAEDCSYPEKNII